MKSEPGVYSMEDLRRDNVTGWDGVRNYQARNYLREMRIGDKALFYHSNVQPAFIAGTMKIVRNAYPDPTQFDPGNIHYDAGSSPKEPRWVQVDVKFLKTFRNHLSLEAVRKTPILKDMALLKSGRLSVQPVTSKEWECIEGMCS